MTDNPKPWETRLVVPGVELVLAGALILAALGRTLLYTGPGDLMAGAIHFWGLRPYSFTTAANHRVLGKVLVAGGGLCEIRPDILGRGTLSHCTVPALDGRPFLDICGQPRTRTRGCLVESLADQVGRADLQMTAPVVAHRTAIYLGGADLR